MPVTSSDIQAAFVTEFDGAKGNQYRPPSPLVAVPNKNFAATLNDDDDNNAVAVFREFRGALGHIKYEVRQKGDGQVFVKMEWRGSTPEAFAGVNRMVMDGIVAAGTRATTDNWRNNAIPTLTSFSGAVTTATVATEKEITFANIAAAANEADSDGTVTGFVVMAVSTGTLKIGATAETAKPYAKETNDTIDANNKAYWTSAGGASGATNAFTVKAKDNLGWLSATAVQAQVTVS